MPLFINGVSRCNGVTIVSTRDLITSGLTAAILNIRFPLTSGGIRNSPIEFLDPENGGLAVGTALISSLEAEKEVLPVWRPSSLNSDFRLSQAVFAIVPLSWWTPKMGRLAVGTASLSCLGADI